VLPTLDVYGKYYGGRVALYILATFYVSLAAAGYAVEIVFSGLGIIPTQRDKAVFMDGPIPNYTTMLDIAFLMLAAVLAWRFSTHRRPETLKLMDAATPAAERDQLALAPSMRARRSAWRAYSSMPSFKGLRARQRWRARRGATMAGGLLVGVGVLNEAALVPGLAENLQADG
jgi:hypothetical protein